MCFQRPSNRPRVDSVGEIQQDPSKDLYSIINSEDEDSNPLLDNCKYYTPEAINSISGDKFKLKVLHINIHSIPAKLSELKNLLQKLKDANHEVDLLLLCETFLNETNKNSVDINGYTLREDHRQTMTKGGVAIYINNKLQFTPRPDLSIFDEGVFESYFVEITAESRNIIVGEVYRIPNTNQESFLDRYQSIIEKIKLEKKDIIIGTDQNLDYLKIQQHSNTAEFLNLNLSAGLLPTMTKPTRIVHDKATLIDNIYIDNANASNSVSAIILSDMSDHLPCLLLLDKKCKRQKGPVTTTKRNLSATNIEKIRHDLSTIDWNVLSTLNVDDSFKAFTEKVNMVLDKYAPLVTKVVPSKYIIRDLWMTPGLLKSSFVLEKLYKKCIGKDKDSTEHTDYVSYRNRYNNLKRFAKKKYYSDRISEFRNNSKKLWSTLNELIGKKNDKSIISDTFIIDDKPVTDPNTISNEFCKYYSSIGNTFASKIPDSKYGSERFLKGNFPHSLFLQPTDSDEIMKIICNLKNKKSYGFDGISSSIFKNFAHELSSPISEIFNMSISSGIVPDIMKIAKVIPVYKSKGDAKLFTSYRPISLLPVLSKLLEKIIHKRLYSFLVKHNILYESQYGFRNSHSTINAVSELTSHILENFDKRKMTLSVFLDLSKAFDTIDHNILLKKLTHYGIRGISHDWFRSYLQNRQQYVQYKSYHSVSHNVDCGVPQGSVLGPLLFILYTNDLPNCLSKTKSILFADDTTIHVSGINKKSLFTDMKTDIAELIEWFRANKLSLNLTKTNYVLFIPPRLKIVDNTPASDCVLKFGDEEIVQKPNTLFLGIEIDQHLNWFAHYKNLNSKLSRAVYTLNRVKHILPTDCMKTLYYSLFHSHLTYGLLLWGPNISAELSNKVFLKQKRVIRIVHNAKYNAHTNILFKSSKILKFTEMVEAEIVKTVYLYTKDLLPMPLMNVFSYNRTLYSTRQMNVPLKRKCNYDPLSKSYIAKGPRLWDDIPNDIKNCNSIKSFCSRLKNAMLERY